MSSSLREDQEQKLLHNFVEREAEIHALAALLSLCGQA